MNDTVLIGFARGALASAERYLRWAEERPHRRAEYAREGMSRVRAGLFYLDMIEQPWPYVSEEREAA